MDMLMRFLTGGRDRERLRDATRAADRMEPDGIRSELERDLIAIARLRREAELRTIGRDRRADNESR